MGVLSALCGEGQTYGSGIIDHAFDAHGRLGRARIVERDGAR